MSIKSITLNKTGSLDRRIQRTRKLLGDALIELILEKGYEAVTVQDIIDRANVGRSTFYAHFENKEQLLFDGHEHLKQLLFGGKAGQTREVNFVPLYQHAAENFRLAHAMLGDKGGDLMLGHMRNAISWQLERYLEQQPRAREALVDGKLVKLLADGAAAGLMGLLIHWLEAKMPYSPERMGIISGQLVVAFLERATGTV